MGDPAGDFGACTRLAWLHVQMRVAPYLLQDYSELDQCFKMDVAQVGAEALRTLRSRPAVWRADCALLALFKQHPCALP
eukprot:3967507-Pleurochrysis_carterae.AAC.3